MESLEGAVRYAPSEGGHLATPGDAAPNDNDNSNGAVDTNPPITTPESTSPVTTPVSRGKLKWNLSMDKFEIQHYRELEELGKLRADQVFISIALLPRI